MAFLRIYFFMGFAKNYNYMPKKNNVNSTGMAKNSKY